MPKPSKLQGKFLKADLLSENCPSRQILKHVTSQWAVLIFVALSGGEKKRFSELRRDLQGVSEKMLSQTLQKLAVDGFVTRTSMDTVPPHVEYHLSPLGKKACKKVIALAEWIEDNLHEVLENQRMNNS